MNALGRVKFAIIVGFKTTPYRLYYYRPVSINKKENIIHEVTVGKRMFTYTDR